ncbi:MAG: hypothetical protein PF542_03090 [Nanoarchaeota archaeon]|jgi:DNA-binding GntR family transcriptional regulator|nr:hypothetical protein [Nanoarchaeota archaeon]
MAEEVKVIDLLKSDMYSITDLVKETGISRCKIRTILARLEGAGKLNIRQAGMAKLHSIDLQK